MIAASCVPHLSLGGDDDRDERTHRLRRALDCMSALMRTLWPNDNASMDTDAVCWRGAVVSLHEVEGHLYVSWKDEDHWDKYAKVAELAWAAAGFESGRVIHENADVNGLAIPHTEPMY
jgi:hypothetical protein